MKLDITQELGWVTRKVQQREHLGRPARVVIARRDYDTDIADLWDAITNPERLPHWFLPVSGELRVGGRYQLLGNAGGEIQACAPPQQLALTWQFGSEMSWLEVQLTRATTASPDGASSNGASLDAASLDAASPDAVSPDAVSSAAPRTRLELRHIAHVGGDRWDQFGPGAVGVGWDLTLRGLGRHVWAGGSIDRVAALAWLASDEGKQFVRESSDSWCRAAIAAGEVSEVASAAAARTTAAYTGETVPAASTRG
ncbi:MAG: SRPBCC domain-containing protein [Deltaproteobacteria bacterium]